jgi:hypothetical protein
MGRVELHLDLTRIRTHNEGLMLSARDGSKRDSEGDGCEGFHGISPCWF